MKTAPIGASSPMRQLAHTRRQHLSQTTPPTVETDLAFWPSWTNIPVDQIDLDQFDDEGNPIHLSERIQ